MSENPAKKVDVLCVGHASYDLIFTIPYHPKADEKMLADNFIGCGGGPAANAAVQVAKLGLSAAFAGYLGNDLYGNKHYQDLVGYGVNIQQVTRGQAATPLSTVLVKPDGQRALINYKADTKPLPASAIEFYEVQPNVILFDGHEPHISIPLAHLAKSQGIVTVLDAGSVHEGTLGLMSLVDHLVCSEKFALQLHDDIDQALAHLALLAPNVVITLGEQGLVWQRSNEIGQLPAFCVNAVDSTGAGDAFHGAYAAAIALAMPWEEMLRFASAAGAFCCTKLGARFGLATRQELADLLTTAHI